MQVKMTRHHNLTGLIYTDNPPDRTIYCRKKHSVIEPTKKECENCACLSGLEQGNGIECSWLDIVGDEHVVQHEDRYKEYERVDNLIKQGILSPKPYELEKWIYINSDDNKYRFALGEITGPNPLICFGINPSTATPENLDLTMKMVKKRALNAGYDGYIMLNICPQRSTNPNGMLTEEDKTASERNLREIENILKTGNVDIWAAWGGSIQKRKYLKESLKRIFELSNKYNCRWLKANKDTKNGHPHHPTRLSYDVELIEFETDEYAI